MVYEGEAESVFLPGDNGDFELMDFHSPLISLVTAGHITIDWRERVPIKSGIVKFDRNECVVLAEE